MMAYDSLIIEGFRLIAGFTNYVISRKDVYGSGKRST